MPITAKEKREQLIREGFCIFENVLAPEMVTKLNAMSEWTIGQEDPAHFDQCRAQGCIIPYWRHPHPAFAELIAYPRAMGVLAELGFDQPKVWSGFVIRKPPNAPPLFWHQDGVLWDHPISYTDQPQQYFMMYYLVDTNRHNGCWRLVPGSHLKRHALHDLRPRDADGVKRASNLEHAAFQHAEGEVDVPVRAGDVVIGDSRLMHAAHANQSDERRTVLTIWYWPCYDELPDDVRKLIATHITEREDWCCWVEQTRGVTGELIPVYDGAAEQVAWNTSPSVSLR